MDRLSEVLSRVTRYGDPPTEEEEEAVREAKAAYARGEYVFLTVDGLRYPDMQKSVVAQRRLAPDTVGTDR